jgi:sensor histidine kinase regulating citrate/malate metabolism
VNAFEAMRECPCEKREVLIRTWQQDSELFAAVTDSGKGIPAGETDKIGMTLARTLSSAQISCPASSSG